MSRLTRSRGALAAIAAIFVALCTYYNVTLPVFEASDEVAHYTYAAYLVRARQLPDLNAALPSHEAAQPPLYYALAAAVISPFDQSNLEAISKLNPDWFDREVNPDFVSVTNLHEHTAAERFPYQGAVWGVRAARLLSTLLGALTVLCVYGVARLLRRNDALTGVLAAAFTAFNPKFIHVSSIVSNDIGVICAASLCCLLLCRALAQAAPSRRLLLALGASAGAAVLCKLGGLALLPAVAIAALDRAPAVLARRAALIGLGFLLVSGWWLALNLLNYGDPLAFERVRAANAALLRPEPLGIRALLGAIPPILRSYAGEVGLALALPAPVQAFYGAIAIAGAASVLIALLRWLRLRRLRLLDRLRHPGVALGLFHLALLASFATWLRSYVATENGRLVMPGIALVNALLAAGVLRWVPDRLRRSAVALLSAALASIAAAVPAVTIQPAFAPPAYLDGAQVPGGATFDGVVRVAGARLEHTRIDAGEPVRIVVTWGALSPIDQSYRVLIEALDARGRPVARKFAIPYNGRHATQRWQAGRYFEDRYTLPVTDAGAGEILRVQLSLLRRYPDTAALPLDTGGTALELGRVKVMDARLPGAGARAGDLAVFDDSIALEAVAFAANRIDFTWRVLKRPSADAVLFVHVLDQDGAQIAQRDGEPFEAQYPTGLWDAGERLTDRRPVELPPSARSIRLGWYRKDDPSRRLRAARHDGAPFTDDAVVLPVAQGN